MRATASGFLGNQGKHASGSDKGRAHRTCTVDCAVMSERADFERVLASLHDAALDPSLWAGAFALIDEILRVHSTATVFGGGGPAGDIGIQLAWFYARGQRRRDLEREYFQDYYHRDERVPRLRRAPDRHVFHVTELFTEEELKASPAYNESMARCQAQDGLNVRMDWPGGASLAWLINDPVDGKGWSSGQLDRVRRLLPHVGQAVRVQHTLASAGALGETLTGLLDATGLGIVQLDARGRIVAANDRARDLLGSGDTLFDKGGFLFATVKAGDKTLQALLTRALPPFGAQGAGGSMVLGRPQKTLPPLVLHVHPVDRHPSDARTGPVAALAVIADTEQGARVDASAMAAALNLTGMESRVAMLLAQGKTVREIAEATGRKESTIRHHVKKTFAKHGLNRQADLVRLVLALAGTPKSAG
ncbi:MAG: hypothetical protein F4053_01035 [Proteobacteria bacterium]|nr:hypothetical protein [Pseudomonadota bacterium]MYJ94215.1 hypothetical protein [Pseudomonadota bacterium]